MKWQQGRAEIDRMLADGELERVQASREHADRLLNQARRHLDSAEATCESDPEGAYGTLYDAGRKALWAILANQGLRPTTKGGHLAVYHAVRANWTRRWDKTSDPSTGCADSDTTPSTRRSTPLNSTPTTPRRPTQDPCRRRHRRASPRQHVRLLKPVYRNPSPHRVRRATRGNGDNRTSRGTPRRRSTERDLKMDKAPDPEDPGPVTRARGGS